MRLSAKSLAKHHRYLKWRDQVALPWLNENHGRWCRRCGKSFALDVDHIISRSQRPDLVMVASNIQLLCRLCHQAKTLVEGRPDFNNEEFLNERN